MEVNYCDVCKKPGRIPSRRGRFFRVADIEICEPCKEDLDLAIKYTVRGKQPFDHGWFDELSLKILRDGVQKGKIILSDKPVPSLELPRRPPGGPFVVIA